MPQKKREIKRTRALSFFAGIGGIELGLELAGLGPADRAGWQKLADGGDFAGAAALARSRSLVRTVGQVELEPYALRVLAARWPDIPRLGDITAVDPAGLPGADVWCGGFPCQDISTAGKREGIRGARSGLFFDWMRLVREVRPATLLMENVAALLGRGLDAVMAELNISGYDAEWDCLPAAALGAPHRRDRVFVIARDRRSRDGTWSLGGRAKPIIKNLAAGLRQWSREPDIPRTIEKDSILNIEARLERLGNAVVTQVAEAVGMVLLDPGPWQPGGSPFATYNSEKDVWLERGGGFFGLERMGSWPRSGVMINGRAWARRPMAPLTRKSSCPTPTGHHATLKNDRRQRYMRSMVEIAYHDKFRTPSGWDEANPGGSYILSRQLLWPTPRAMDGKIGRQWRTESNMDNAAFSVMLTSEACRREADAGGGIPDKLLNPAWVEWLMGFPAGWTEVPDGDDV